ncbi:MAG: hypothetical protein AAGG02_02640 [Cyanobacteria bacterium P01_H01_bin.15]
MTLNRRHWLWPSCLGLCLLGSPALGQDAGSGEPEIVRPLSESDSLLSYQGGEKLLAEAESAISDEKYELAATKLQQARQVFNQLTNFYLDLANSFSGIENRIYEEQRQSAAQTGQKRDEATYKLALVHRAEDKPELAVPLLIQVIRSQNPTTELGKKSYQQLYELGFVGTSLEPADN